MSRHFHFALAVAAVLPLSAQAQEPTQLPEINVFAADNLPFSLQPSLKREQKRLDRVAGGTNLAQPQEETRLTGLNDALGFQPGIVIQDFFGGGVQPRLNLRGSGIQSNPVNRGVLLLQDGLPLNEADGSFVIGVLEPRNSSLISVRRGANATTPGATTLGGELDFQSLTGVDENGRIRIEGGSFGSHSWQAALGGENGQIDGRVNITGNRADGYRSHSDSERDSLQANVGFLAGDFENRSYLSLTDLNFEIPFVVPKDRIKNNPTGVMGDGASPFDGLLNVRNRKPYRETEQRRFANRTNWGDEHLGHEFGVYLQGTKDTFNNPLSSSFTDSDTIGAQWQIAGQAAATVDWRMGLAWSRSNMDRTLNAVSPENGQNLQRFADFDLMAENQNLLAGMDWQFADDWLLTGDLKWAKATRDARERLNDSTLDQSWSYFTPKLGLIWTPASNLRLYANISRSQEAPTYWEIISSSVAPNNPAMASSELVNLNVQRATTFEIGGQGQISDALNWDLSIYHSRVEDELISTTDPLGISVGTYNYAGNTRHQGLEAGINGTLPLASANVDYRAAWTYNNFRFVDGEYDDNHIAGIPSHLINAEALYRIGSLRFGPNVRWMPSDTSIDHANTKESEQEAYALLGFKVDYQVGDWRGYLQGDNLTDKRYASSYVIRNKSAPQQPSFLPGNGRSVSTGITYQF